MSLISSVERFKGTLDAIHPENVYLGDDPAMNPEAYTHTLESFDHHQHNIQAISRDSGDEGG